MEKWGTQLGQLWKTKNGPHRVIGGDCTDETVVGRLFESATAARYFRMLASDPSYGISYAKKMNFLTRLTAEIEFKGRLSMIKIRMLRH
jgi:hypothetical protein